MMTSEEGLPHSVILRRNDEEPHPFPPCTLLSPHPFPPCAWTPPQDDERGGTPHSSFAPLIVPSVAYRLPQDDEPKGRTPSIPTLRVVCIPLAPPLTTRHSPRSPSRRRRFLLGIAGKPRHSLRLWFYHPRYKCNRRYIFPIQGCRRRRR